MQVKDPAVLLPHGNQDFILKTVLAEGVTTETDVLSLVNLKQLPEYIFVSALLK